MDRRDINLIDVQQNKPPKKSFFRKFLIYPIIIFCIAILVFTHNVIFSQEGIFHYLLSGFKKYPLSSEKTLAGEENDMITFLILGMGGENHDGGTLTDTIMALTVNPEAGTASITSIPRDLLVDIPDYGKYKINHAYALTERDSPGSGGDIITAIGSRR